MFPTIYLQDNHKGKYILIPREIIKEGEKWIKHVSCDGARFHVLSYGGRQTWMGFTTYIKCSEPDCIYNKD